MLFVIFRLGDDRYALPAQQVVEVLPLLQLKQWPRAAPGVAGVCVYRGQPLPVLDLSALSLGRPALNRLSTRLLVVRYPDPRDPLRLLGLVAEEATDSMQVAPGDFASTGVRTDGAPFLGPVACDAEGVLQRIEIHELLSAKVRDTLFVDAELAWQA